MHNVNVPGGSTAPAGSRDRLDVLVIGGGPAGSLVASLVRRQDPDRSVLVLEREKFPRHHVGESSIPSWRPVLERAGVLDRMREAGFMRKAGTLFWWGPRDGEAWTLDFRDPATGGASPASYQVDRAKLDHLLLEHARSLGAEVHEEAEVRAVDRLDDGAFRVRYEKGGVVHEREATFVLDASGQGRVLSRLWNIERIPFDDMNNFAVFGYWKGSEIAQLGAPIAPDERWTYITTCDAGWVWHIPIQPDLVSVGVVTDASELPAGGAAALEEFYLANVRGAPGVGKLLEHAELVQKAEAPSKLTTVRDWSYRAEPACGPGWFLVGDAAAFVDPILSSGLLLTTNGAGMAANALHTIWNDRNVDLPKLLECYGETYRDMALSYHSLARIWYSRNFTCSTWHWEAKRQRLSTGRAVDEETAADAFLQLALGSFTNPVEGAFADRGLLVDLERPDAHIYAAHLFGGRNRLRQDLLDAAKAGLDNAEARSIVQRDTAARWRQLIASRARVVGCSWRERDGYFTDGTMSEWRRVQYVEVRPDGEHRHHDRVVFPKLRELPRGVMEKIVPGRTIGEILGAATAHLKVNSPEYTLLSRALYQQVMHLAFRKWLEIAGDAVAPPENEWEPPPPLAATLAAWGITDCTFEFGLLGHRVDLEIGAPVSLRVTAMPSDRVDPRPIYWHAATVAFAFKGASTDAAERFMHDLGTRWEAWETAHPAAARAFWTKDAIARAAQIGRLTPRGSAQLSA